MTFTSAFKHTINIYLIVSYALCNLYELLPKFSLHSSIII